MSKAILVLDKMPRTCYDCPYCRGYYTCDVYHYRDVPFGIAEEGRPYWCPLKETPENKEYNKKNMWNYYQGYVDGWNNCLDEILETEY